MNVYAEEVELLWNHLKILGEKYYCQAVPAKYSVNSEERSSVKMY